MKTSNVHSPSSGAGPAPVKSPTAPPAENDSTDFMTLFNQVMGGSTPGTAPSNILAAALPLGAASEQEDSGGDLDESELAMMMAALTGSPAISATPASGVAGGIANSDLLQAGSTRTNELTAALVGTLATQAGSDADGLQAQDSTFDTLMNKSDLGDGAAVDPRVAQGTLDTRGAQQTDAPVTRQMHAPVGTRAWNDELGAQINWMTERGHQSASLRLSPEHLGPLEIRISIQDDQASVWFGAAHADTRAAIEGALPRLREMLASQGLALNDAGVFKEAPRQQPQFRGERNGNGGDGAGAGEDVQSISVARLGLVDAYA